MGGERGGRGGKGGEKEIVQRGYGSTERRWERSEENELSGLQGQQKVVIAFHKPSCFLFW